VKISLVEPIDDLAFASTDSDLDCRDSGLCSDSAQALLAQDLIRWLEAALLFSEPNLDLVRKIVSVFLCLPLKTS
jgi:hypothetical protein